jgi:hypothetical protein
MIGATSNFALSCFATQKMLSGWKKAVQRSLNWIEPDGVAAPSAKL